MRGPVVHLAALLAMGGQFVLSGSGCGKGATTPPPPVACTVSAPTECPAQPPHYQDVQAIFARYCVDCHRGAPEGPWSLAEYENIVAWADFVRDDLLSCSMPPQDAAASGMSNDERVAILSWILCGSLE